MKVLLFILTLLACVQLPALAQPAVIDGVKGVVASRIVTFSEVESYTRTAADSLQREYYGQPQVLEQKMNQLLNDGLEQLVERLLILRSFDTEGYKLPDGVVDEMVHENVKRDFGDRITFMKTLQARGMTVEQYRKQIRDQYIESALRNQHVQRQIFVSPYKVETYYQAHQDEFRVGDEVKLRMIVLPKSGADDTNTVKLAREIETEIKNGTPFKEMAATYSQGSQQHQGGDWGWVERSVLRKELADVAFKLKPGVVSDPVETADTIYLMMVDDVRPAHVRPLNEVEPDIEKTLRIQEQARLQKQWIDSLKKKTFIRYF
jgi:peptidyl-prolyl cis-trans isomerase SurA